MSLPGLTLGLLDRRAQADERALAERVRDLTLAFSRFKYDGVIVEETSLDALLRRAAAHGARYLLAQAHGYLLAELWRSGATPFPDLLQGLARWAPEREFLAAGLLLARPDEWFGLSAGCLLIDVERWQGLGEPACEPATQAACELPAARLLAGPEGPSRIERADGSALARPRLPYWGLVRASLEAGLAVWDFGPELRSLMVSLEAETAAGAARLGRLLGADEGAAVQANDGSPAARFLLGLRAQAQRLPRGVFPWNLESYDDVRARPPAQQGALRTLYSVAAGLKPNFMLHALGADERTRVVYVDYSAPGLAFRRLLHEHWDGDDYPRFLRFLFRRLPPGEASYCLWDDATPETLDWAEVERRWQAELHEWGGTAALAEHWRLYRGLAHEYVLCDLLRDPSPLLQALHDEDEAALWWSNAFFSVPSLWALSSLERERRYRRFVDGLAARAPCLWLYGSSSHNLAVNGVRAAEYASWYARASADELAPGRHPASRRLRF